MGNNGQGSADKPVGKLFSHVYDDRGPPELDSSRFRRRLAGYVDSELDYSRRSALVTFLMQEAGLSVPVRTPGSASGGPVYDFEARFLNASITEVLIMITVIWRFLNKPTRGRKHGSDQIDNADAWQKFVSRVFKEENLGYELDNKCGVHYLVDQEFERNRVVTLAGLELPRYANVRDAFERAHHHLDSEPRDRKAAVRSMFESLEILTKLMVACARLDVMVVDKHLKPLVQRQYADDPTADQATGHMFDGFKDWVISLQQYRHGQGREEPVAPPTDFAIYVLSSGAAFLRWLLEIDHACQGNRE